MDRADAKGSCPVQRCARDLRTVWRFDYVLSGLLVATFCSTEKYESGGESKLSIGKKPSQTRRLQSKGAIVRQPGIDDDPMGPREYFRLAHHAEPGSGGDHVWKQ